ncbi:MAG: hypothetical protein AABZ64_07580 [Nitrospinota bacterium]
MDENDRVEWSADSVYKNLCDCFSRKPGALCLTETEFKASQEEYLCRAVSIGEHSNPKRPPRRPYQRKNRKTIFEKYEKIVGPSVYGPREDFMMELHRKAFAWIVLKGESEALGLRKQTVIILRNRYPFLPQTERENLQGDLTENSICQACVELAEELGMSPDKADEIRILVSPSQAVRSSSPPSWAAQLKRFHKTGKVLTKTGREVGPGLPPRKKMPTIQGQRRTKKPSV